jgi:hypothetical protein
MAIVWVYKVIFFFNWKHVVEDSGNSGRHQPGWHQTR